MADSCLLRNIMNGPELAAAVLLPSVGGGVVKLAFGSKNKRYYDNLHKPCFHPPEYVFAPVWTVLYSGIGYASYIAYKQGGGFNGPARYPLMLYGAQLALNWTWTPILMHYQHLKWSLIQVLGLTVTAAVTGAAFYKIDKCAGLIFVPYLTWLTFSSFLAYSLHRLNSSGSKKKKKN